MDTESHRSTPESLIIGEKRQKTNDSRSAKSNSPKVVQHEQAGASANKVPPEGGAASPIDTEYSEELKREIIDKGERASALLRTLGLVASLYDLPEPDDPAEEGSADDQEYDREASRSLKNSNGTKNSAGNKSRGQDFGEELTCDITDRSQYPTIPPIDKILHKDKIIKPIDGSIETPVLLPNKKDLRLRRDLDMSLLSEAIHILSTVEKSSEPASHSPSTKNGVSNGSNKTTDKSKTEDTRVFSPQILVKLAYVEALKRSIEGDSYAAKGGLQNIPTSPLCFSLTARHLETYTLQLRAFRDHLTTYRDKQKEEIEFETKLNEEVNEIGTLAIKETEKTEETTAELDNEHNENGTDQTNKSKKTKHHPYHTQILTKLAKRRRYVQDEVTNLMNCLKFVIEDHLASYIATHSHEVLKSSAYFSRPERTSASTSVLEPFKNRPETGTSTNGTTASLSAKKSRDPRDETQATEQLSKTLGSTAASVTALENSGKYAIPKELTILSDYTDETQISTKLQSLVLILLNQLVETSEERALYLQVPTLDDPVVRLLLNCQIVTQAPHDPNLICLRDFGKPATSSSKIRIKLP